MIAAAMASDFLNKFKIPNYILVPESKVEEDNKGQDVPQCPVLVFVNSKSGGQLGGDLLQTYRALLNEKQVCLSLVCPNNNELFSFTLHELSQVVIKNVVG